MDVQRYFCSSYYSPVLADLDREIATSAWQRNAMTHNKHDLGQLDPAFEGFLLQDGKIILPNGYRLGPGYLHAIPIRMQLIATLQRQLETPKQLLL